MTVSVGCFSDAFVNRKTLVTGHTGFKGSWLSHWLCRLGADVYGLALDPDPDAVLFDELGLGSRLTRDIRSDIRDLANTRRMVAECKPEYIFHLAAQPLVRYSFEHPIDTFSTNVMGTANLLDAVRHCELDCTVIVVTTDKCYENKEWIYSYRENDPMGGHDPYSASKGCAEIVTSSFRNSYFSVSGKVRLASARAGNVIGGGDWSADRIVPDIFRAVFNQSAVPVRNRRATRPWQHVLEPLSGYLWLAACLSNAKHQGDSLHSSGELETAFNFGPYLDSNRTVLDLVQEVLKHTGGDWIDRSDPNALHEASRLNLSIDRAFHLLNWKPVWDFGSTIDSVCKWYLDHKGKREASELCDRQIDHYETDARRKGIAWSLNEQT